MKTLGFLFVAFALAGCASMAPTAERDARREVASRLRVTLPDDPALDAAVTGLLARPLTADTAAAVALLRNPELAADFASIGIAEADWVQAGILRNPALNLGLEFPGAPPSTTRIQASFTSDFIQLLTLPRRHRIAEQEYLAVRARACARAVAVAAEAKAAVVRVQALDEMIAGQKLSLELERAASDLSARQHDAGNIADLDLARRQEALAQGELVTAARESERQLALLQLERSLGTDQPVRVAPTLGDAPPAPPAPEIEALAARQRWEVAAARAELQARRQSLGLVRDYAWTDALDLGAQFERDVDGQKSAGPTLALPVPLFDRADAHSARAAAALRQAVALLRAAELTARLDVREASARLQAARVTEARERSGLLPARHAIVQLTGERYNGMYAGPYDLVVARQAELAAQAQEIIARRDAWLAWIELERAAGGNLQVASQP